MLKPLKTYTVISSTQPEIIRIFKYPNNKFYIHYGSFEINGEQRANIYAGPFIDPTSAIFFLNKSRPTAVEVEE